MRKLLIFGGSGIGMIAASIAHDLGYYDTIGFLNDMVPVGSRIGRFANFPVLGKTEHYIKYLADNEVDFFVSYIDMQYEKRVYDKITSFEIPIERYATLIHPTAILPRGFCEIGFGVLMAPLSQLSPDTKIGDNCMLLANCMVGHNSTLDRFAHVATNGVVGANVHLGKAVHVGSNATIREKIKIGDFVLIGSGSVVLSDVPDNTIVVGNPARVLRTKE